MNQSTAFNPHPVLAMHAGRQAWHASFQPVLADLRTQLQRRPPQQIAQQAGVSWDRSRGEFQLQWLDQTYCISWPDLVASVGGADAPASASVQGLLLYYLSRADGTPRAEKWIGFRELPDGWLYHQAFQRYTGHRLTQGLGNDLPRLTMRAAELGGLTVDLGDRAFAFHVLPAIWLAVIYWQGDEEFPPQAQVLFDPSAAHYLPADGLAMLGRQLVDRLLEPPGEEETRAADNRS